MEVKEIGGKNNFLVVKIEISTQKTSDIETSHTERIATTLNKQFTYWWPNWWRWRWLILKDYKQNNGKKEHA